MSHILITRPAEDGMHLAKALEAMGHQCLRDPMLNIHPIPTAVQQLQMLSPARFQAIIVTSKHALCAMKHVGIWAHLPVFAVGTASANAARKAGFGDVHVGASGIDSLAATIRRHCDVRRGDVLYLRGQQISQPLHPLLPEYNIQEIITYRSVASTGFSEATKTAITHDSLDLVLFFSRRSASIFQRLLGEKHLPNTTALCLSAQVGGALFASHWKRVDITPQPSLHSMLLRVDQLCIKESNDR